MTVAPAARATSIESSDDALSTTMISSAKTVCRRSAAMHLANRMLSSLTGITTETRIRCPCCGTSVQLPSAFESDAMLMGSRLPAMAVHRSSATPLARGPCLIAEQPMPSTAGSLPV